MLIRKKGKRRLLYAGVAHNTEHPVGAYISLKVFFDLQGISQSAVLLF